MLVKAGVIMSSEVNPEGQPSDTAFRPLTTKSKSWIWHLYARRVCFVFVFSTEDETKLPVCFCLFGLIHEYAQGNQSKQATPAAMGHHQRVASLGPGYPRVTSEGGAVVLCHFRPSTTGLFSFPWPCKSVQDWATSREVAQQRHRVVRLGKFMGTINIEPPLEVVCVDRRGTKESLCLESL